MVNAVQSPEGSPFRAPLNELQGSLASARWASRLIASAQIGESMREKFVSGCKAASGLLDSFTELATVHEAKRLTSKPSKPRQLELQAIGALQELARSAIQVAEQIHNTPHLPDATLALLKVRADELGGKLHFAAEMLETSPDPEAMPVTAEAPAAGNADRRNAPALKVFKAASEPGDPAA